MTPFDRAAPEIELPPSVYTPDMTTVVGRLKHLRHVVERIPPEQFDMDTIMKKRECGTFGCMLGWAASDRHFNDNGLTLAPHCRVRTSFNVAIRGLSYSVVDFAVAAEDAFGIQISDGDWLFRPGRNPGEHYPLQIPEALKRIDVMIKKYAGK